MDALFRFRGAAADLKDQDLLELVRRSPDPDDVVRDIAAATIDTVRFEGDSALRSLARDYDGVDLKSLEVDRTQLDAAVKGLSPEQRAAITSAISLATDLFANQAPREHRHTVGDGQAITYRPDPLDSVGVYVPGVRTPWPTAAIATVVPARLAGVREIVVCAPPQKRTGRPDGVVLAACALAGATRIFSVGGAGALAAMAYGTQTVPRVDKIFGAGNPYTIAAKGLLGAAASLNAPSIANECVFLVDETADAAQIAREIVAQSEVDDHSSVLVLAMGTEIADRIEGSVMTQLGATERQTTARAALREHGALLTLQTTEQAIAFISAFAPAVAVVATKGAAAIARQLRQVGCIHLGSAASPAVDDCLGGLSASAPSGGLARSYSVTMASDFYRWTVLHQPSVAAQLLDAASAMATASGLDAHARAIVALARG